MLVIAVLALMLSSCGGPTVDCGPFAARDCAVLVTTATGAIPGANPHRILLEAGPTPSCPAGNCHYLSGAATVTFGSWFSAERTVTVDMFGWTPEQVEVRAITELSPPP
jgi:hypothetical protein